MIRKKRAQIQISFGMIFSLIIIIATIAVAFYVITYFLDMSKCTKAGTFWKSIQDEVDNAMNSDMMEKDKEFSLPSGIKNVCFGEFTQMPREADKKMFEELEKKYELSKKNAYFYPLNKVCDELVFRKLTDIRTDNFFCINAISGKINLKFSKESNNNFVKLSIP